jgi:glycosyltransferase involved in cell wall biosynthesis
MKKSVSFIIPAYNESKSIDSVLLDIYKNINKLQVEYEFVIIDDGSQDTTLAQAEAFIRNFNIPGVVLQNKQNKGKQTKYQRDLIQFIKFLGK